MSFLGGLFGGTYTPEQGASAQQAQELYKQQQEQLNQQRGFTTMLGAQVPGALESQKLVQEQLRNQMAGTGPSVAQRQLAQATGQNVAQQAALLAGQRGASQNVGLAGRTIGQLGTQAQQQSAGQAATLRAGEQLAAQQRLADLASGQLGQVQQAQQTGLQGTLGAQQNVMNALGQYNQAQQQAAQQRGNIMGGLLGAAGTILGGPVAGALGSLAGNIFSKKGPAGSNISDYTSLAHGGEVDDHDYVKHIESGITNFKKGGSVPAMVSPGERYLPPREVAQVKEGKKPAVKAGEQIPGQAKVKGDSLKNDIVPANLEPGGIVIPRSVMQSKNPEDSAQKFVAAVLAKQKLKRK
jgi:hypothetical protein